MWILENPHLKDYTELESILLEGAWIPKSGKATRGHDVRRRQCVVASLERRRRNSNRAWYFRGDGVIPATKCLKLRAHDGKKVMQQPLRLFALTAWFGAVWGALQIHKLDLQLEQSICGVWGCGPPTEALIGYHTFWMLLLLPLVVSLRRSWPERCQRIGWITLSLASLVLLLQVGFDAISFARRSGSTHYLLERAGFTLATSVDLPVIPVLISAGTLLVLARFNRSHDAARDGQVESEVEQA